MRPRHSRLVVGLCAVLVILGGAATYALAPIGNALGPTSRVDRIVVEKAARRLTLLSGGQVLKSYRISLGHNPLGPKHHAGDGRTPEGTYLVDSRNSGSAFHLSLHVSYPNSADLAQAAAAGVPPGGNIMIHGMQNGFGWIGRLHRLRDWTDGCIAVTDTEIEEIYRAVPDGTVIEIRP